MYRRKNWEQAKSELKHYKRREPEQSALYRVVYHGRELLPIVWEKRFQGEYGVLRDEVLNTYDEYLNCGLLIHGAARVYCDNCKHSLLVAFSCKKRGVCPSCSAKRAVKFAEHLYQNVLHDVPHRHIVFSIPKRLRVYFRYNRKLLNILFRAASLSISNQLGKNSALILTVQTAGEALNFNPHLHGILADGVFTNSYFQRFREIDLKKITDEFTAIVLSMLEKQELITEEVSSQINSQAHTGFSVWLGDEFQDSESEQFVARYVERGPLSLEKLSIEHDILSYSTKDEITHEFDALEFMALLSSHIPKPYESITRYYGWYSCRRRGDRIKAISVIASLPEPKNKPSPSWAASIKRIYEINPLECPKCKSEMKIVAFIHDAREISKISKVLGIQDYRAPPPLPCHQDNIALDEIPDYDSF